jgi:VWFA-related protein
MTSLSRRVAAAALGLPLLVIAVAVHAQPQSVSRTIYVTVTQADGRPVLDMRRDDFEVREGGRVQEISSAPATNPLRVALIVSDRGGGQFQQGAVTLCEAVLGSGEIAITGIVVQPERLTDFTNSPLVLRTALLRLGRRSAVTDAGAQLIEAILDATKTIRRDGSRSAIVIMRAGGEDTTPIAARTVLRAIGASRATMYVVSPAGVDRVLPRSGRSGESVTVVPTVLGVGPGESGGRQIDVAINTMRPAMRQVASELLNQYEITYTLPQGVKPDERVSVATKRKGVTVRGPTRIAD